jgi:hypothetical protein
MVWELIIAKEASTTTPLLRPSRVGACQLCEHIHRLAASALSDRWHCDEC